MCGRMNLSDSENVQALMNMLGIPLFPANNAQPWKPRWNIAPQAFMNTWVAEPVDTAGKSHKPMVSEPAGLYETHMRWGIPAPWSEPGKSVRPLINARSETVLTKPTFKHLVRDYRAIVAVNGFYEWERVGSERLPYYVSTAHYPAMLIAAVYQPLSADDYAKEKHTATSSPQLGFSFDDEPLNETSTDTSGNAQGLAQRDAGGAAGGDDTPLPAGEFAIVTTEASGELARIHHRTPVILNPEQAMRWLVADNANEMKQLMAPETVAEVVIKPVSTAVNSSRVDGPECLLPPETDAL